MTCNASATLLDRISTSDDLPSLPSVAIEVLRLTRSPDTTLEDITEVIQNDPALSAKMLKVVNSSLFGLSRPVSSITQAISLLGIRTVKVMALSFSLVDVANRDHAKGFDYEQFWRQSLTSAVAARLLASTTGAYCAEEAFVACLLADIGSCIAYRSAPDLYGPVLDLAATADEPLHEVEQRVLGVTHAEISRRILAEWGLPDQLCTVVASHHDSAFQNSSNDLEPVRFVYAASLIGSVFCRDIATTKLDAVREEVRETLGISDEALEDVLKRLDDQVHEAASLLSVQIGETNGYDRLRADATAALTQLSIEAEADRLEFSRREATAREEAQRLSAERQQILQLATTDKLTGLNNRAAFDTRLEEEIERARRDASPIGLIMLDVDHFKAFNDRYGHQAGDAVLRMVGCTLGEVADRVGFAARYGGEEFAVILVAEAAQVARKLADLIRRTIASTDVQHAGAEFSVTASFGVIAVDRPDDDMTADRLIELADKRLYVAKKSGRDCVIDTE